MDFLYFSYFLVSKVMEEREFIHTPRAVGRIEIRRCDFIINVTTEVRYDTTLHDVL